MKECEKCINGSYSRNAKTGRRVMWCDRFGEIGRKATAICRKVGGLDKKHEVKP
jgi:hypothetical protein